MAESWEQYRMLVTSELERNDQNIKEVLKAVNETNTKLASIETAINSIKRDVSGHHEQVKNLEIRMMRLEKDHSILKTKVLMAGGAVATFTSIIITAVAKFILS